MADVLILLDIKSKYETETYGITSMDLLNKLKNAYYTPTFESAAHLATGFSGYNSTIVVMGEGDITEIASVLLEN